MPVLWNHPLAQTEYPEMRSLRWASRSLSACNTHTERTRAGRRGSRLTAEIPQGKHSTGQAINE